MHSPPSSSVFGVTVLRFIVILGLFSPAQVLAAPIGPTYVATFDDAVTGDSAPTRSTTAANIGQLNYTASGNGGRFTNASGGVSYDIDQFQPGSLTQRADDYLTETYERSRFGAHDLTPADQASVEANLSALGRR